MTNAMDLVKQLREITGAGILDCKKYLERANNDLDEAIKLIRSEAGVKANKKGSRIAAEGIVGFYENDTHMLILELNSETDFVARSDDFIKLSSDLSNLLLNDSFDKVEDKISNEISSVISKLGENIKLRRHKKIEKNNHMYGYTHNNKITAIVELQKDNEHLAKDICMQVVASNPLALDESLIDQNILDSEKEIYKKELDKIDKKDDIKRNILEGKMKKFINENTLLNQPFVKDPSTTLAKLLKDNQILSFFRYEVGEGLEKKTEDFAQELYNQIS